MLGDLATAGVLDAQEQDVHRRDASPCAAASWNLAYRTTAAGKLLGESKHRPREEANAMTEAVERAEDGSEAEPAVGRGEEQDAAILDRPRPQDVDERRFAELEHKKSEEGLTDEEANELGWMIAAKEGQPYSNAGAREHPDASPEGEAKPTEGHAETSPRRIPSDPIGSQSADETSKEDIAR